MSENQTKTLKIALIFGGCSDEHEVSRMSAVNVLNGLRADDYDIKVIGITKSGRWYLTEATNEEIYDGSWEAREDNRQVVIPADPVLHGLLVFDEKDHAVGEYIDCVFPVLHGDNGEDGTIQGLLTMAGIPYVGCGIKASAVSMDKTATKIIAGTTGVTQARYAVVKKKDFERDPAGETERVFQEVSDGSETMFVKPSSAGSSVGVTKVTKKEELQPAIEKALIYDDKALIEELIVGREIEIAVLGNEHPEHTAVGEILTAGVFYDYDSKYNNPESKTRIADDLPEEVKAEVGDYAIKIFKALDCRGLSRVDFFYDEKGRVVFNEINTMPGFTNISMYPQLWENAGLSQPELLRRLIDLALEEA